MMFLGDAEHYVVPDGSAGRARQLSTCMSDTPTAYLQAPVQRALVLLRASDLVAASLEAGRRTSTSMPSAGVL